MENLPHSQITDALHQYRRGQSIYKIATGLGLTARDLEEQLFKLLRTSDRLRVVA